MKSIVWKYGLISGAIIFAVSLVLERERGTLLRLRAAPLNPVQLLGGKGLACFLTCVAMMALLLVLARVAFGGAVTGMAGMAMASVMLAAASTNGADVDPVVSKSVATASGGPFLIAAMGFAAFLMAAGPLTLRTRVFARWTGFLALIGGVCFLVTFLTVLGGMTDGSAFGYAFFPAIVSLVIWSIATMKRSPWRQTCWSSGMPTKVAGQEPWRGWTVSKDGAVPDSEPQWMVFENAPEPLPENALVTRV